VLSPQLPASENLELECPAPRDLVIPCRDGGLCHSERVGDCLLATEVLNNVLLSHLRTKTDLSVACKHVLAEPHYSLGMPETTRGARIKEARLYWQSQGTDRTVKSLCVLLGISEPTYYNWEGDKVDDILANNLMKFSKVTGFHPSNRRPKLLAEDAALAELMSVIDDFNDAELQDVIKHARLIRSARRRDPGLVTCPS
jgi:hypothetical protein